ncbi:autotransporter outer membrane beta-barrel domain-containing protein [Saprospiraceae bacterium]|nr:autotransporter outer membrane beta-barrel domain-containing protein [Saprospiraceae bacterium]
MSHNLNTELLCPSTFVSMTKSVKFQFDFIRSMYIVRTLFLSFILLVVCSLSVQAQSQSQDEDVIMTNNNFAGLTASFQRLSVDGGGSQNNYSFRPSIGRYLNENIALGLTVGYSFTDFGFGGVSDLKQFSAGAFMRYIINPENKLQAYLQPSLEYRRFDALSTTVIANQVIITETDSNAYSAAVDFGLTYDITDRFRLLTRLAGMSYVNNSSSSSIFSLDIDFSNIRFGAEYRF